MNRPGNSVWGDRQAKERRRTDKPQRSTSHSMAHQTSASAEAWPAADCRCLDIRRHVARAPFFASQRLLSRGLILPNAPLRRTRPFRNTWILAAAMGAVWVAHAEARPYPAQAVTMQGTRWEPPATLVATAGAPFSRNATGAHLSEHRRLFRTQQRPHPVPPQPPRPRTEILRRFPHPSTTPGRWACWPRSRS